MRESRYTGAMHKVYGVLGLMFGLLLVGTASAQAQRPVWVLPITGVITAATAQFVETRLERAAAEQPLAVVLELDTPGGSVAAAQDLAAARDATAAQLQPYKSRMERATYEQTFDNLLLKRLRDQCELPRLSLFYL